MHRDRLKTGAPRVLLIVGAIVAAMQVVATARISQAALLSAFTDDFYYYYVVARNLVTGGSLSFDGVNPTNGFHPLWLAVISALYAILGDERSTLLAVKGLCALLPLAGAWGLYLFALLRLARARGDDPPVATALAIATLYYALAFYISKTGMEVALTLALLPAFVLVLERGVGGAAGLLRFTLLAALVILSRLDSAILVLPLWFFGVVRDFGGDLKRGVGAFLRPLLAPRVLLAGIVGFAPLWLYAFANLTWFGGLMPQSASAKALVTAPGPFFDLLNALAWKWTWLLLALWGFAGSVFVLSRDNYRWARLPGWIILIWPALFYAWLALRSPWPLWQWYLYPLVFSAAATLCVRPFLNARWFGGGVQLLAMCVVALVLGKHVAEVRDGRANSLVEAGYALRGFERTHPGTYAMGDRAGVIGHLFRSPVLQLEGLVGGRDVIDAVNAQEDLAGFLHRKGIRYYIATDLQRDADGCHLAAEPKQGSAIRRMRATLCSSPIFAFRTSTPEGQVVENLVFDLQRPSPPAVQIHDNDP